MHAPCEYVIVGAGLFGSVFARLAAEAGRRCLVVDRRPHVAGNCFSENVRGIEVHRHGPHIFHTNDERVWGFVTRFADFHPYVHRCAVRHGDRLLSFPINLLTFHQLWGVTTPAEVEARLERERIPCARPGSCEEWILSQVGREIYETFFRGYTAKQWNRDPAHLPASIVRRIPIRLTYDDRYFADRFQGVPVGGYTRMFENLLDHDLIRVETGVDFLAERSRLARVAPRIVYTGCIDEFFDHRFGRLDYRSLRFEHEIVSGDHQGMAIVNYTEREVPHTRITEHKHFEGRAALPHSVITREYPADYGEGATPYYPVRDERNTARYERYRKLAVASGVIFGGRLGTYQYYDMHQVVAQAMAVAAEEFGPAVQGAAIVRRAA
jgi:UDP-galactopyranose mutase